MKQFLGLVSVFGVFLVGVLIAPGSSGAASINISVNGGTPASIPLGGNSCSTADRTAGYTSCHALAPGSYAGVTVASVSGTNPARLLIADRNGSGGSLDMFTLSGVRFTPPAAASVRVVYSHTFNAAPN